jgi:hypothetical protein
LRSISVKWKRNSNPCGEEVEIMIQKSRVSKQPNHYKPVGSQTYVLTRQQAKAFEARLAEPPRQPTEAERELVRMFNRTVSR